jgi:hypothetical protein
MAQPVYATEAEYATWLGTAAPAGSARALRAASGRVDELLITAYYDTDDDGAPTEADVIEALMEATCAQADYQRAIGDASSTGAPRQWASVGIGSARLSRGQSTGGGTASPGKYSSEAYSILQRAGLIPTEPWVP